MHLQSRSSTESQVGISVTGTMFGALNTGTDHTMSPGLTEYEVEREIIYSEAEPLLLAICCVHGHDHA